MALVAMFQIDPLQASSSSQLERIAFDEGWLYYAGENDDARFPETEDSHWRRLDLPHSESSVDPTLDQWYRKRFNVSPDLQGKRISIHFDGAIGEATIWLNGHFLGTTQFAQSVNFELSRHLHFGKEANVLSIKLSPSSENALSNETISLSRSSWLEVAPLDSKALRAEK